MARTTSAFRFEAFGEASVLKMTEVDLPEPAAGEIQIEHAAIGVNYIDIYHRKGVFAAPLPLPSGLGMEGVGTITALGAGVSGFAIGDRVAYVGGPPNGYSQARNLPAARALAVPDDLTSETVAALIFKGLTVEYLIHRCRKVEPGDTVLWHAAAGGVGSIACQWLSSKGVTVIGTVGSPEKTKIAEANGGSHVINYRDEDFEARVKEITHGAGVDVVFNAAGADTFAKSLNCLRPRGSMVSFGEASGPVAERVVQSLNQIIEWRGKTFDQGGQWPRICQFHTDDLGQDAGHRLDPHPTRQAPEERLCRAPQPDGPARMAGPLHP